MQAEGILPVVLGEAGRASGRFHRGARDPGGATPALRVRPAEGAAIRLQTPPSLLPKLLLCAWKTVGTSVRSETREDALPGAIMSIQTAGDFLNWHPHLHILAKAGAFAAEGEFLPVRYTDVAALWDLFHAHVLRLLHRCHILIITGRSYRFKELEKLLK